MPRDKRPPRKSIRPYYFIVEGFTEKNYLDLLKQLFKKPGIIHNCEGGNAKNVLLEAKEIIAKSNSDDYSGYIIWFDQDRYYVKSDSNLKNSLEKRKDVTIYISKPCIENWLLAHFQPINLNEYKCNACIKELRKYIPNYHKNKPYLLQRVITEQGIEVAIANYPELGKIRTEYFGKIVS